MLLLDIQHVRMHQHAINKTEALQCLTTILVEEGLVSPEYIQGFIDREEQSATYLGQGIAIPHGTPASRQFIKTTGVRIAHFPEGVVWDGENKVYLAVAIAAKSDEHLQVLQLLTKALLEDVSEQVRHASTAEQVIALLQRQPDTLHLHENLIATQIKANDIEDFFWHCSQLLKKQNMVECGFLSALQANQLIPLANDIWFINANRHVQQSAICIVTAAEPILIQNQSVKALICIASNASLDQTKLTTLLEILFTPEPCNLLRTTDKNREIAELIGAEIIPDWPMRTVIIANAHGLHARPATELVKLTQSLTGDIRIAPENTSFVSAKSLTKLLALGCKQGQRINIIAEPDTDAELALDSIITAIEAGLGEDVPHNIPSCPSNTQIQPISFDDFLPQNEHNQGIAASSGLAFGPAYVLKPRRYDYAHYAQNIKTETERLEIAIHSVKNAIHQLIAKSDRKEIQQIFNAHLALLEDPELLQGVHHGLKQGLSAAAAWHQYIESAAQAQAALADRVLAERAADLRDIGERVLANLCDVEPISEPDSPFILIMQDVGPSDVATLDTQRVAGILTAVGGASAHSAIVARALGIPAIVGAGQQVLAIDNGTTVLINGDSGEFSIAPEQSEINHAITQCEQIAALKAHAIQECQRQAITVDGHQIEIAANIGDINAAAQAVSNGAEAIGLLRTELVFMAHQQVPDLATQEHDYRVVLDALQGRPLVVRTLDVGGDKPLPYLPIPEEENPFLGLRGIRLTLRKPELLAQQLQALLQAADDRPLRIMFPMIARMEEWRAAKAIIDDLQQQFPQVNLQVGIMVEVPSAALLAPLLAQEVDFFSIGTNDLTQYTLAIDRGHPVLSAEADGLHPSLLLLIDQTVRAAHQYGKWVGICGELAADAKAVPILLGLGVDELSMSSTRIPLVKAQIRTLNYASCQALAQRALHCDSASAVRALGA